MQQVLYRYNSEELFCLDLLNYICICKATLALSIYETDFLNCVSITDNQGFLLTSLKINGIKIFKNS